LTAVLCRSRIAVALFLWRLAGWGSGLQHFDASDGIHTNRPLLRCAKRLIFAGLTSTYTRLETLARLRLSVLTLRIRSVCDLFNTVSCEWTRRGHRRRCKAVSPFVPASLQAKPRKLWARRKLSIYQRGEVGNSEAPSFPRHRLFVCLQLYPTRARGV